MDDDDDRNGKAVTMDVPTADISEKQGCSNGRFG